METSKRTKINSKEETVVNPQLAEPILEINKKAAEIKKLCKELLDIL